MNPQTLKRLTTTLIALLLLSLMVLLFLRPYQRIQAARQENALTLQISMGGWDQKVLKTRERETLKVSVVNLDNTMHSDGGGWHNFIIEGQNFEQKIAPMTTGSFTLPALGKGTYTFYCDICCGGKDNPFMRGEIQVEG
ncbi:cupredoxin domain-containing protein [Deinococcus cellulosilyticus]|uniref:EfeO-type cupredoxin-like domain-containing protein n=1 Tax=Deinococcus cellulosilyticus (strain DSM 18568 / NBRC 106333 / KACC 11606 / 5516J-15) TaxID=1223518 RepID=A0A511N1C1_DEIC1|nr:cupredoxin domain-containing protein [Deinococcus cellulosilyticus]GEM46675.1 hypothetical protein DC3_23100 [Deinococcus cellulosilyticus NBRC 106333 = KACC 11606]